MESDEKKYGELFGQITKKAVVDTISSLLKYPYGFHGDTGIRDYLYAKLLGHGEKRLEADDKDKKPGFSTLLLQSEHYTDFYYLNKKENKKKRKARFDLALTLPPSLNSDITNSYAENLQAYSAFELGKNKTSNNVIDDEMHEYKKDHAPKTSDVSKLYLDLVHHNLVQGWAIEFYDLKPGKISVNTAAKLIKKTLLYIKEKCSDIGENKKLVVIFVIFSKNNKHLICSNDNEIFDEILKEVSKKIEISEIIREPGEFELYYEKNSKLKEEKMSEIVEELFGKMVADRIKNIPEMRIEGKKSGYVNLKPAKKNAKKNVIAQFHPHKEEGIAIVFASEEVSPDPYPSFWKPINDVSLLKGSASAPNIIWLNGSSKEEYIKKGTAVAFLIPKNKLDNDDTWEEVGKLLDIASSKFK